MKIILSRKGFDSGFGGGPSPIVNGVPITLPIPATIASETSYGDLGLGELAELSSKGKYTGSSLCHHDPMFLPNGTAALGQHDKAQGHLANQQVGLGDVFLFFGWFAGDGWPDHHRIFGYLEVQELLRLATDAESESFLYWREEKHPHALKMHSSNDVIYSGPGRLARSASPKLALTDPGCPRSIWRRPSWLNPGEISHFGNSAANWPPGQMTRQGPGQEFVADIGDHAEPRQWLEEIISEIRAS